MKKKEKKDPTTVIKNVLLVTGVICRIPPKWLVGLDKLLVEAFVIMVDWWMANQKAGPKQFVWLKNSANGGR